LKEKVMPNYQLGTARLAGRETVVLVVQNAYVDLSTLCNAARVACRGYGASNTFKLAEVVYGETK
jgi:hypothetical protein